ncbi:MAG: hypothetical protein A7315_06370 [Candidatus Altiarchaeales archaeon WOR_SM1_79]|nr:MAG: hypothetical protein A7315_06370 [Candidatus Altiarchaeales archaeon WOR_SM1_79]
MMQKGVEIIGCRGKIQSVENFIKKAKEFLGKEDAILQFIDADKILGKEHIYSAIEHAERSFERGDNISATKAMEILIYTACEPQINNALAKVGLKDGCEKIAMIIDGNVDLQGLLLYLNIKRDDKVLELNDLKLREFGISGEEISAVKKDKIKDLILERVAMVDVKK